MAAWTEDDIRDQRREQAYEGPEQDPSPWEKAWSEAERQSWLEWVAKMFGIRR
jgi:hypothetical protein